MEGKGVPRHLRVKSLLLLGQSFLPLTRSLWTARKIIEAVDLPFVLEGVSLSAGASIGIAIYPDHGTDAGVLMDRADRAMYAAKENGGGYAVYQSDRGLPRAV